VRLSAASVGIGSRSKELPTPVPMDECSHIRRDAIWLCEVRSVARSVVDDELDLGNPIEQDLLVLADKWVATSRHQQHWDVDGLDRLGSFRLE
jgi:hypothetical protein